MKLFLRVIGGVGFFVDYTTSFKLVNCKLNSQLDRRLHKKASIETCSKSINRYSLCTM